MSYSRQAAMAVFLACSLSFSNDAGASLIAHWTGDGTAEDATGNDHHGTLVGNTTYAPGKLGQAFSFDGIDDYITIPTDLALEPAVLSVAAWIKIGSGLQTIVDSSHGFVDQQGWALQVNGTASFAYGNGSTFPEVNSTTVVTDNVFHHVAAVLDGTSMSIYVDGELEGSGIYSLAPSPSLRDLRIGSTWGGNPSLAQREVSGLVDDVRVYDHALSLSEIRALAVPEPSSFAILCATGTAGFLRRRRRF
tara:strand:+ start:109696 stop:110442 length:747 start_codon:yes stop_codon:yes gene_type:complete